MASNYEDVLGQLRAAGLQVDHLEIGRLRRCKVEGDRERRGWYQLHELRLPSGDDLIVGSYGVWRGTENNAIKIEVKKSEMTREQQESLRARLAEDRRKAELARKADAERAAQAAADAWRKCKPDGDCEYLHRKGVQGHGVRYTPQGVLVIPVLDVAGKIHGLQLIRPKALAKAKRKPEKEFWPVGMAISYFQAFGEQGYKANMTERSKRNLITKGTKRMEARRYFVSYGKLRGNRSSHLAPGIWAASGTHGVDVRPVLMFVRAGQYMKRLDTDRVAKKVDVNEYLARRLRYRIRQAAGV